MKDDKKVGTLIEYAVEPYNALRAAIYDGKEKRRMRAKLSAAINRLDKIMRGVNQGNIHLSKKYMRRAEESFKKWKKCMKKTEMRQHMEYHPWHKTI